MLRYQVLRALGRGRLFVVLILALSTVNPLIASEEFFYFGSLEVIPSPSISHEFVSGDAAQGSGTGNSTAELPVGSPETSSGLGLASHPADGNAETLQHEYQSILAQPESNRWPDLLVFLRQRLLELRRNPKILKAVLTALIDRYLYATSDQKRYVELIGVARSLDATELLRLGLPAGDVILLKGGSHEESMGDGTSSAEELKSAGIRFEIAFTLGRFSLEALTKAYGTQALIRAIQEKRIIKPHPKELAKVGVFDV